MKDFPPFRLDLVNQCLWRHPNKGDDERILLTPKAFAVLRYLVEHAGRLVTHDELLDAVWPNTHIQPQAIKKLILDLRGVLGDRVSKPLFIETLHRRGYRFIAAVSEDTGAHSAVQAQPARGKLVGRERVLIELSDCLGKALRGERQIVFVTGEPGIGKTALTDAFQRQAATEVQGLRIARGQCVEGYGGKEAYYPILEALGDLCRGSSGESVIQSLAAEAPTWLVQFPALVKREQREVLQREILGATRERMLREIGDLLEAITAASPLLLVLEDLQWVDYSTLDLISALARRRAPAKLMLIATKRPVDMVIPEHPLKALKQDLLLHQMCREINLEPLGEAEVAEYLAAESSEANAPEGLAKLVYYQSEGNPLFMVASLDHMTERGLLSRKSGAWRLRVPLEEIEVEVPQKLRRMIELQIDRLKPEEQRALAAASVAGMMFSTEVCAAAVNVDPEAFEDLCQELSRRHHIVRSAGSQQFPEGTVCSRYEFVHALYREVSYRSLAPAHRARLHQRIGERLETLFLGRSGEVAAELAQHFEEGSDWSRAVKYLQLSAETATQRYAHREAAMLLERALALHQDAVGAKERADLLASLGMAERGFERRDAALAHLEEALEIYLELGDREAIGRSFTELTDDLIWAGRFQEAAQTARRGLAYLQPDVSADRVGLLAAMAQAHAFAARYELAQEALREASNIVSQLSDPKLEAKVLGARSIVNFYFFRLREAAADGLLIERPGGSEAHPWQRAIQLRVLHQTLLFLGRLEDAMRIADELEPLATKIGQAYSVALCITTRAWAQFGKAPDLAKLETCIRQVEESGQKAPYAFWDVLAESQLSLLDFYRGNWAGALSHAEAACRAEPGSSIQGYGAAIFFRQMAYCGERARAFAILDEKRMWLPLSGHPNTRGSWVMLAPVIEGLVILGERAQAGQLYPLARELVSTGTVALFPVFRLTHTVAGVAATAAGQWEDAEEHFQIALQQAGSFPQILEQAEIRRFHAMMLMERGTPADRKRARRMLTVALETYASIGMPLHCDLIKALMGRVH